MKFDKAKPGTEKSVVSKVELKGHEIKIIMIDELPDECECDILGSQCDTCDEEE